jgi:hypothetical protein
MVEERSNYDIGGGGEIWVWHNRVEIQVRCGAMEEWRSVSCGRGGMEGVQQKRHSAR